MKTTLFFFWSFLFSSTFLFSQISIDGELRLGDDSQVLLLETKDGSRLLGNITKWTRDSLQFKITSGDVLNFKATEVLRMTAQEKASIHISNGEDLSQGIFTFYADDGKIRKGQLISMDKNGVRIKYKRTRRAYLRSSSLEQMTFEPYNDGYNYPNSYNLYLKKGKKVHGSLVHLNEDKVIFRPDGKDAYAFPRSQVTDLKLRKGPRPMIGHQQALLLTPTGFNLRKGESEFRNINYIFNNYYSVGINDRISATAGLFGIEPYFKIKASQDFGRFIHLSAGGGISLTGGTGWHASASLGTPEYYLNLGYMQNQGELSFGRTDMDAFFFGGSWRIGNRQRLFAEATHIIEKRDVFDSNGWGSNYVAFGYGWFGRRISLNLGLMAVEHIYQDTCFVFTPFFTSFPCGEEIHDKIPIPVISTSIYFGEIFKKVD